jgi:hypothetical protein
MTLCTEVTQLVLGSRRFYVFVSSVWSTGAWVEYRYSLNNMDFMLKQAVYGGQIIWQLQTLYDRRFLEMLAEIECI